MSYLKIGKYQGDSLTANTYVFDTTLSVDYKDISSIDYWFNAIDFADIDYTFARTGAIGFMMNNGGFTGLTSDEKLKMAQNFCAEKTDRDSVMSTNEQELYWELFIYDSENARKRRWSIAKSFISFRLSKEDGNDLGADTDILTTNYLRYDITSFSADGRTGLYDWLNDTHIYSGGTGFSSKDYYTTELRDGIIDRLDGKVTSTIQQTSIKKMVKPEELRKIQ